MSIKIGTKKVVQVIDGVPTMCRKITHIEALPLDKLPPEYIMRNPFVCYFAGDNTLYVVESSNTDYHCIIIEDVLTETKFQSILKVIEAAGQRLTDINAMLKMKAWNGEEVFTI